ncbi:hypothetical protein ACHHYP_12391 [Achlya hypogyna]|uniref:Secreted protein n=1 Tax=Achlya hypogyna TaxID=1202772 RepID=A0A0A7CP80_ACHHY|nr:secreted protein [Achlya hypogyna]OQR85078.1 hypothetical protein ACHHYP_12391 [Achlya hypogyna]
MLVLQYLSFAAFVVAVSAATGNYRIYTSTNQVLRESKGNIVVGNSDKSANELFEFNDSTGKLMSQSASRCLGGALQPMVLQNAEFNVHMKLRLGLWLCFGDSVNVPWVYDATSMQFKHIYYAGWCLDASTSPVSIYLCDSARASQRFRLVASSRALTSTHQGNLVKEIDDVQRVDVDHHRRLVGDNPPGWELADESEKLLPMRITLQSGGVIRAVGTELYVQEAPRNTSDEWFEYNANRQTVRALTPELGNNSCLTLHLSNSLYFSECCAPDICTSQQFVFYKNRLRHPSSFCVARNQYKPDTARPMSGIWCNDDRNRDQWLAVYKDPNAPDIGNRRLDVFDTRIRAATGKLVSEYFTGLYVNWAVGNTNEWFSYDWGVHTFRAKSNGQCIDAFWSSDPSVKWWVLKIHTYNCEGGNRNQEWAAENNHIKHLNHAGMCLEARNDNLLGVNSCKYSYTPGEWLELAR